MHDHVLVPVSFDDDRNAAAAISVARRLIAPNGKLTLLHVMEAVPAYALNYIPEGFHEDTKTALRDTMSGMAEGFPSTEVAVIEGHSGRSILEWAEENRPDCIILASHRPGLSDYFLGSTASQVVRHAKCSVHVVR